MGSFTKGEQIFILFIVLIVLFSLGYKLLLQDFIKPETPTLALVDLPEETALTPLEEDPIIMVHISGQIFSPGVYEVVRDDRLIDVVELAGGLTKEADLDRINLAKKVQDEEKIYIPKIGEISEPIDLQPLNTGKNNNLVSSNTININTASIDELDSLPGVGEVIAQRIVDYRSTSPFKNIEDLKNVSGIGDKIFAGLKDLISVK